MLNPLKWKPEHRAGFLVATAAGAALGIAFGFTLLPRGWHISDWFDRRLDDVAIWAIIGAMIVGGAIYCYRIFSN